MGYSYTLYKLVYLTMMLFTFFIINLILEIRNKCYINTISQNCLQKLVTKRFYLKLKTDSGNLRSINQNNTPKNRPLAILTHLKANLKNV